MLLKAFGFRAFTVKRVSSIGDAMANQFWVHSSVEVDKVPRLSKKKAPYNQNLHGFFMFNLLVSTRYSNFRVLGQDATS